MSDVAWNQRLLHQPHQAPDKQARVRRMFRAIAPSYDLNNRLHSFGLDQWWRKAAVKMAQARPAQTVVDVACGTGDLSFEFAKKMGRGVVIGIDYTFEMLPLASGKQASRRPAAVRMQWIHGDGQALPLADECADVVSIAFGIRNVADPSRALGEFFRVLKPGGRLVILEFAMPTNPLARGIYNLYFQHILPLSATLISRDRSGAYRYLPRSVQTFGGAGQMERLMAQRGFTQVCARSLTLGACWVYRGIKPEVEG